MRCAEASAGGAADLSLALAIPLDNPDAATVRGALQLAGNDLRLLPGTPLLAQAPRTHRLHASRASASATARARALGGELSFDGGSQADGRLRFQAQGQATAEGLLRPSDLPMLAPLAALVGRARHRACVGRRPTGCSWTSATASPSCC